MKIYISYFYQIRFFKSNQIPLSTAKWQPKWYGTKPYIDKNGVINGLCAEPFVLPEHIWNKLVDNRTECHKDCKKELPCEFMRLYKSYLNSLDFQNIIERCNSICARAQKLVGFTEEPELVLMVHESKSCKCAERPVLQEWFRDNGYILEEWKK